ncbi:hypothetical protein [Dactylosporangium sp. CS-033363]|uniref:hypothetical protein n=1 Tax=Dactylosporangium sp. CS-033363 TaxID=3239935 RepID=UPI003D931E44
MAILAAAVAVVGVLCVIDLLLTVGVIRRLREHTEQLAQALAGRPPAIAAPGTTVDFDGSASVVGFFSPGCGPCAELLPKFVERVAGESVLAVVVGDGAEVDSMVELLAPVARVVREDHGGTVAAAFGVSSFPSVFAMDGRTIAGSGHDLGALRAPVGAGRG